MESSDRICKNSLKFKNVSRKSVEHSVFRTCTATLLSNTLFSIAAICFFRVLRTLFVFRMYCIVTCLVFFTLKLSHIYSICNLQLTFSHVPFPYSSHVRIHAYCFVDILEHDKSHALPYCKPYSYS